MEKSTNLKVMEHEAGSREVAHGSGSECAPEDNIATQPQGGKWAKVCSFV
jgi:hypothetical protein